MTGTYWETSRKPLYVRTIWTDGHHHAVLNEEDPVTCNKKIEKRKRVVKKKGSPSLVETVEDDFNVSTVRILLSSVRRNEKNTPRESPCVRKEIKRTYTIDVIPTGSVKFKDFNREVVFKPKIAAFGVKYQKFKEEQVVEKQIPKNSLSERVMVWLDLAAQNGQYYQPKPIENKKRKTPGFRKSPKAVESAAAPVVEEVYECFEEDESKEIKCLEEEIVVERKSRIVNSFRQDSKRQLHIFIPNVPKKNDCDSTLTISTDNGPR